MRRKLLRIRYRVHIILHFKNEVIFDRQYDQAEGGGDPDEEGMEDVKLDSEREHHRRMVFEDNAGGVEDKKALLNAKSWYICVNENQKLIKGGYLVEVFGYDGKKFFWEVVDDHVIEEVNDHDEIALQGAYFNLFD